MNTYDTFVFDDFVPRVPSKKEFAAMTDALRHKLEVKRGRKHIWLHRRDFMEARRYAEVSCTLTRGFSHDTLRVPYVTAFTILQHCDQRYANECAAEVTRALAL